MTRGDKLDALFDGSIYGGCLSVTVLVAFVLTMVYCIVRVAGIAWGAACP